MNNALILLRSRKYPGLCDPSTRSQKAIRQRNVNGHFARLLPELFYEMIEHLGTSSRLHLSLTSKGLYSKVNSPVMVWRPEVKALCRIEFTNNGSKEVAPIGTNGELAAIHPSWKVVVPGPQYRELTLSRVATNLANFRGKDNLEVDYRPHRSTISGMNNIHFAKALVAALYLWRENKPTQFMESILRDSLFRSYVCSRTRVTPDQVWRFLNGPSGRHNEGDHQLLEAFNGMRLEKSSKAARLIECAHCEVTMAGLALPKSNAHGDYEVCYACRHDEELFHRVRYNIVGQGSGRLSGTFGDNEDTKEVSLIDCALHCSTQWTSQWALTQLSKRH